MANLDMNEAFCPSSLKMSANDKATANNAVILISNQSTFASTIITNNIEFVGGGGDIVTTTYYKMRGYYTIGSVYETYVVADSPSPTPPSGHILTDVVIIDTWIV